MQIEFWSKYHPSRRERERDSLLWREHVCRSTRSTIARFKVYYWRRDANDDRQNYLNDASPILSCDLPRLFFSRTRSYCSAEHQGRTHSRNKWLAFSTRKNRRAKSSSIRKGGAHFIIVITIVTLKRSTSPQLYIRQEQIQFKETRQFWRIGERFSVHRLTISRIGR